VSDNRRIRPAGGRMIPVREYQEFKRSMADALWASCLTVFQSDGWNSTFPVRVGMKVWLTKRMDTTAVIKAACDAVQLAHVVLDDRQIVELSIKRMGEAQRDAALIRFEIEQIE
jgi:Holliday junction resolvase RusA-like endonuclease